MSPHAAHCVWKPARRPAQVMIEATSKNRLLLGRDVHVHGGAARVTSCMTFASAFVIYFPWFHCVLYSSFSHSHFLRVCYCSLNSLFSIYFLRHRNPLHRRPRFHHIILLHCVVVRILHLPDSSNCHLLLILRSISTMQGLCSSFNFSAFQQYRVFQWFVFVLACTPALLVLVYRAFSHYHSL